MKDLVVQSLATLARLIREREVSPVEIARAHLERIAKLNPALNAIVALAPDVLDRAKEAEAAIMRGDQLRSLHGVPVTIKDTMAFWNDELGTHLFNPNGYTPTNTYVYAVPDAWVAAGALTTDGLENVCKHLYGATWRSGAMPT